MAQENIEWGGKKWTKRQPEIAGENTATRERERKKRLNEEARLNEGAKRIVDGDYFRRGIQLGT